MATQGLVSRWASRNHLLDWGGGSAEHVEVACAGVLTKSEFSVGALQRRLCCSIPALPTSSWRQVLLTGFQARLFGTAATFLVQARFTATASFVTVVRGRRGGDAAQMVLLSERSEARAGGRVDSATQGHVESDQLCTVGRGDRADPREYLVDPRGREEAMTRVKGRRRRRSVGHWHWRD